MPNSPTIPKDNARLNVLIKSCRGYVTLEDVAEWFPFKDDEPFDQWLDRTAPDIEAKAIVFVSHESS